MRDTMDIINCGNIFTNKQLYKYIKFLGTDYIPNKIVICEKRTDIFKYIKHTFISIIGYRIFQILFGQIEGIYNPSFDLAIIYVFSENDDGDDLQSKQLYSLHAITHELRHRYQVVNKLKISEKDADEFATSFVNNNSEKISKIMKWKDEWEVEEED
jgi:hypothetical protein